MEHKREKRYPPKDDEMKPEIKKALKKAKELEKKPIPTKKEQEKELEDFMKNRKKLDKLLDGTKR